MGINGMGTAGTLYLVDGTFNMNSGNMAQTTILPNPDQAFNIFNHTNFNAVNTTFGSGQFGQVTGAADPRIFEFALRMQF
jgi:hypothetical protein